MGTTWRENRFFKRILKGHQERTKRGKSAAHSSGPTERLCANCSDIDLFAILKGDHKGIPLKWGYEVWVTRSSDPTAIWIWDSQPGCEFCEFISATQIQLLPRDDSKCPRYLQLDRGKSDSRYYEKFGPSTKISSHVNIVFDTLDGRLGGHTFSSPIDIVSFSVATHTEMPDFQPWPLQVDEISTWLDLNNIKRRLQNCLQHHDSCGQWREASSSRPSRLRVIDCSTRSIITPSAEIPYVALSYRWGESHRTSEERQSNKLPENVPATIEDVILITRTLGFQYLWVDKYCVLQADESDFKHQIRQMHLIYRSAQITIIAGGSMDANSGLTGVSTPRDNMQTRGRYDKLNLITFSLLPWSSVFYTRGWIDRGWTLQESYFSQRRLIFTDKQVFFECDEGIVSEDLQHSQIAYSSNLPRWKTDLDERDVYGLVEEYTRRALTYDDDILNACDGIIGDLEQKEPPIRSHWGIMSVPDASGYLHGFLVGLCWCHPIQDEKIRRRLGFPSWSWAGWSYESYAHYRLWRKLDTSFSIALGLAIQVEKESGLIETWKTFEEASPASTQRHHHSQRIHISAPSLNIRLRKNAAYMKHRGRKIHGHVGLVVRSEGGGYWSSQAKLDTPFKNLELSPNTHKFEETRACYAICLFTADKMRDWKERMIVHTTFAMLLVSKVGTNWGRVGLWQQLCKSEEEAQSFEQWLQSSLTYKTRDFWIA